MTKFRVLVVGLDGADPKLIRKWIGEGRLPTMARMAEQGISAELISTFPPVTMPAWPCFMTGTTSAKNGIIGFKQSKRGTYGEGLNEVKYIDASYVKKPAFWDIAGERGKKIGLMNIPATYPARKVNGFMISGLLTPVGEKNFTYPKELASYLIGKYGYKIGPIFTKEMYDIPQGSRENPEKFDRQLYLSEFLKSENQHAIVAMDLMKRYKWDFMMVVYRSPDEIGHYYWGYMDPDHAYYTSEEGKRSRNAVRTCYEEMDQIIGKMLTRIDKDTVVIVMSDHGMGLHAMNRVNLDQWLFNIGFLKLREGRKGESQLREDGKAIKKESWRKTQSIDWSDTKAYCSKVGYANMGGIEINVKGEKPEGIVAPGKEFQKLQDFIISELKDMTIPGGNERLVQEVHRREELFSGPYLDLVPHIIFELREDFFYTSVSKFEVRKNENEFVLLNTGKREDAVGGIHRKEGIVLIMGPNIRKNIIVENANIIDLAPTILEIMKVPIPSYMDGRVLRQIFIQS